MISERKNITFYFLVMVLVFTHEDPATLSKVNIDVVEAWELPTLVKPATRIRIDSPNSPRWVLSQEKPGESETSSLNVLSSVNSHNL